MSDQDIEQILREIKSQGVKPEEMQEMLALFKKQKESEQSKKYNEFDVKDLQASYERLLQTYNFQKGQLVIWKKGLKNRKFPEENQPAIVIEVLDEPLIQSERDSGTPYFREPLDIALGIIDRDGDFLIFHYDQRRFKPYS
jgi:hypothetical protein